MRNAWQDEHQAEQHQQQQDVQEEEERRLDQQRELMSRRNRLEVITNNTYRQNIVDYRV